MSGAAGPDLVLPSAGPEAIPLGTALAAVLGYARGRRPLRFRSPGSPEGRWVQVPAFGYERFDCRPRAAGPLGDDDVLTAEGLHGRLDRAGWAVVRAALDDARGLADAATERAAGRPLWELTGEEFSVLREPGTVGAALRGIGDLGGIGSVRGIRDAGRGAVPAYVSAALHHRRPELFPLLGPTTRRQLLPHVEEGDSGVEAVVHRELQANAEAFAVLGTAVAAALGPTRVAPTRLRLHDVLVWASGSLRLAHAVALGARAAR